MSIERIMDLGYFSHFPVLGAALARTLSVYPMFPILECGVGDGSTHLIHLAAGSRYVVSADTNADWIERFADYLSSRHRFIHVHADIPSGSSGINEKIAGWLEFVESTKPESFSLAFIDCEPGEARVPIINALRGQAKMIVAHDRCADEPPGGGNYGWKALDGVFTYQTRFTHLRPHTAIYTDDVLLCMVC